MNMSDEEKKEEKKSQEGSKALEREIKAYVDSYKIVESFAKDAVRLQKQAAMLYTPAMREMARIMTTTYPALQAMAKTMAAENAYVYRTLNDIARVTASIQNAAVHSMMRDMASVINNINKPYIKLARDVMQMRESFRVMTEPINIESSLIAARNNTAKRTTALENALVRLEKELTEKDIENKELRRLIKELLKKNKKTYVA